MIAPPLLKLELPMQEAEELVMIAVPEEIFEAARELGVLTVTFVVLDAVPQFIAYDLEVRAQMFAELLPAVERRLGINQPL